MGTGCCVVQCQGLKEIDDKDLGLTLPALNCCLFAGPERTYRLLDRSFNGANAHSSVVSFLFPRLSSSPIHSLFVLLRYLVKKALVCFCFCFCFSFLHHTCTAVHSLESTSLSNNLHNIYTPLEGRACCVLLGQALFYASHISI
jgi:hypothetical protein